MIAPDFTFLKEDGKEISKASFIKDLRACVNCLNNFSLQEVYVCQQNLYNFALSFFAAMVCGKKLSIFSNEKSEDWVSAKEDQVCLTDENALSLKSSEFSGELKISEQFQAFFYTSGSSGKAKKIPKNFDNLYLEALGLEKVFDSLKDVKRIHSSVSHNHIYGFLFRFLWPVLSGRKVHLKEIVYHEDLTRTDRDAGYIFLSSPAFLKRLDPEVPAHENIKAVFSSGGLLSKEVSDQTLSILLTRPIEVFGSTETGGVAYRQQSNPQSLWIKFPAVEISSTEDSLLKVRSPFIYENEFVMGDLFKLHDNNRFELLGRADRIAKVEEKRVSLVSIEKLLNSLAAVKESAVIFFEDEVRQQTCAVLVLTAEGLAQRQEMGDYSFKKLIQKELSKNIDLVVVPKRFRFVDELPYNEQSKILFQDLRSLFL